MKKFLLNVFYFVTAFLVLLALLMIIPGKLVSRQAYFHIDPSRSYIIMGHSQPGSAFNDSLIPGFINLADATEGYFYTYIKARKLLESNSHIKALCIEVTNNQFVTYADDRIYGRYAPHLIPKYLSQMTPAEWLFLLRKAPGAMLQSIPAVVKNNLLFLLDRQNRSIIAYNEWGGFTPLAQNIQQRALDSLEQHSPQDQIIKYQYSISEANLWYLGKIVKLAESKQVKVYFFRSPMPKQYRQHNEGLLSDILTHEFPQVPFLDFKDFPLRAEDFFDFQHINYRGATKFSAFFKMLADSHVLELKNPQALIHSKMSPVCTEEH